MSAAAAVDAPNARASGTRRVLLGRAGGLLALLALTVGVRLRSWGEIVAPEGVLLSDRDTMRRLARLVAIDQAGAYPVVETLDGYPHGTVLHWTLPMDVVLRVLDALLGWLVPGERGYEGGAVLAGPLLALVAVAAFVLLGARLLGFGAALAGGALYALGYSFVNTSLLGNGDHQTLQQPAAVLAVLGLVLALQRAAARGAGGRWAAGAGAALGFSVWVSTELMLLFYVLVAALVVVVGWRGRDPAGEGACRQILWPWSLAVLAMIGLGHVVEHRDALGALHWDSVSLFQVWQAGAVVLFALALRVVRRAGFAGVAAAGTIAVGIALLPFVVPGVRAVVYAEIRQAREVAVWLHAEVSEFRGLFAQGAGALFDREGAPVVLLPLAWWALRWAGLGLVVRRALAVVLLGTFTLYAFEVKLGHLFALIAPLLLAGGGLGVLRRFAGARTPWLGAFAVAAALVLAWRRLPGPPPEVLRSNDRFVREICSQIAQRRSAGGAGSVLAPWDMGAALIYRAGAGVVASGYHRNLDGIRDGYRFWLADVGQLDEAKAILRARRVRWVVAWYSLVFLRGGPHGIGRQPLLSERGLDPAATRTVFWKLRHESLPGFRLVAEGPPIRRRAGDPGEPVYRLWAVEQ